MSETLWRCPVCHAPIQQQARHYFCAQNHSFDQAKEGYVNLLLANKKKSTDPGDNRAMLDSRRYFLQQGFYAPLAQALVQLIQQYLPQASTLNILDAGCGEGYYLDFIATALQHSERSQAFYGTDISRHAMRMAAKQYPNKHFAVASSFDLPLQDAVIDVLLRVFAPASDSEIARVLRTGGVYLWAYPGARHLFELRQLVYDDPKQHETRLEKLPQVGSGLGVQATMPVSYALHLPDQQAVAALLAMTPYFWSASSDKQAYCQQVQSLDVTVDFEVAVMVAEPC